MKLLFSSFINTICDTLNKLLYILKSIIFKQLQRNGLNLIQTSIGIDFSHIFFTLLSIADMFDK